MFHGVSGNGSFERDKDIQIQVYHWGVAIGRTSIPVFSILHAFVIDRCSVKRKGA